VSEYDYGPLLTYEVVWRTGHIETVQGHRVYFSGGDDLLGHRPTTPRRFNIYGDFPREDGGTDWRLVLHGLEDDVLAIREVTTPEQINAKESS
jgi:hypothetical protein